MAIHLFLMGLSLALSLKRPLVRTLWRFTGWLSLALAGAILVYSWMPNTTNLYAPGSVIFIVVALMLLLTGIMMLIRSHWYRESLHFDYKLLTPSVVVSLVTILVWFSLSAAAVRDVNERGRILQEQIAGQINNSQLLELRDALKRVSNFMHAENADAFSHDAQLLLRDFHAALGISVHNPGGEFSYFVEANGNVKGTDLYALAVPPAPWLQRMLGQEAYTVTASSVYAERPILFFTVPIRAQQNGAPQATMAVDLQQLLDFKPIEFLRSFEVHIEIAPNFILPANTPEFALYSRDDFHATHPFSIRHSFEIIDAPLTFFRDLK